MNIPLKKKKKAQSSNPKYSALSQFTWHTQKKKPSLSLGTRSSFNGS